MIKISFKIFLTVIVALGLGFSNPLVIWLVYISFTLIASILLAVVAGTYTSMTSKEREEGYNGIIANCKTREYLYYSLPSGIILNAIAIYSGLWIVVGLWVLNILLMGTLLLSLRYKIKQQENIN